MEPIDPDDRARQRLRRFLRDAGGVGDLADPVWVGLLVSYIEGDTGATWVLGDFLAERGLPRLKPGSLDKRVRTVLGVLPATVSHAIACDCVEHVLEVAGQPIDPSVVAAVAAKRRWLAGQIVDDDLWRVRRAVRSGAFAAEAARQAAAASPSPGVPQRVAALAASAVGDLRSRPDRSWDRSPLFPHGALNEARWQAAHLCARLGAHRDDG